MLLCFSVVVIAAVVLVVVRTADTLLEATQDPSIAARLATQPWLAIPSVDPLIMAHAAKTYARLVARGGALVKNVELQVQTASEWLQGGSSRQSGRLGFYRASSHSLAMHKLMR